jgi:hypothetical protein
MEPSNTAHRPLMAVSAIRSYICATAREERNMDLLKQLGVFGLAVGLVLAGHIGTASAQSKGTGLAITPVSDAALTAPPRNTYGKVRSISGHVLTLEAESRDMIFIVDENTQVLARGAGRATRTAGGSLPITDLIHGGDIVRVEYRELNGAMRVVEIQIKGRNTIASR